MQPPDDEERFFFIEFDLVTSASIREGSVEPLVEGLNRVEHLRQRKVEQGPQFGEVILERCTRKDKPVPCVVVLRERLGELALRVLHTVAFIYTNATSLMNEIELLQSQKPTNDHVRPTILAKHRPILDDVLVGGEEDLEISTQLILQLPTSIRGPFVRDNLQHRHPFGKLKGPVHECRQGYNDEVWPAFTLALVEEGDERNGLDSFTHYIIANKMSDALKLQIRE